MRNRINEINVTISERDTDVSGANWDGAFGIGLLNSKEKESPLLFHITVVVQ